MTIDNKVVAVIKDKRWSKWSTEFEQSTQDLKDFKIWYVITDAKGKKQVKHTLYNSLQHVFDTWKKTKAREEGYTHDPTYKNITLNKVNRHEFLLTYEIRQWDLYREYGDKDYAYLPHRLHYFTEAAGKRQGVLR